MNALAAEGFARLGRRPGCRNHVLVLPSVVCATATARAIANRPGAVTITHQHGCSQVGDDGTRTHAAFVGCAVNPNVAAVLVAGLGCETIQGRSLATSIEAKGQRVEYVGIQEQGGLSATVAAGGGLLAGLVGELDDVRRVPLAPGDLVVGIELSRVTPIADLFVLHVVGEGAAAMLGAGESRGAISAPAFAAEPQPSTAMVLVEAGVRAQQHVALAAAGAQVIVSFPAEDDAPVGFPLCPVVAVASASSLHRALADDFDLSEADGHEAIWDKVVAVIAGAPTLAEVRGDGVFALERIAMSM